MRETKIPNKLANEKSTYLRQHIFNLVNWYPWSEEAFAIAKIDNKPIFLSIGYSSCHWCHIMALECFENQKIADYLNEFFIPVKVDREERPDIDRIYMNACQVLTGSGGWPLSVFIDYNKRPFYAGTYYPPQGFHYLLKNINKLWQKDKDKLIIHANIIVDKMKTDISYPEKINYLVVEEGYLQLKRNFDSEYGGFFSAPKFPMPHYLLFLLKYYQCYKKEEALYMVQKTLDGLRSGGIYDQIGYGFCRYSTDKKWIVPHFEKMLYDNAMLMYVYTEAYKTTNAERYRRTSCEIADYLLRRLKNDKGGFFTAEDADSEGEEGKYYLFSYDEICQVLKEKADIFCRYFNITSQGTFAGLNIPYLVKTETKPEDEDIIAQCLQKIFNYREKRVKPKIDNKILTSLNGLVIAAFALAGRVYQNNYYIRVSEETVDFIIKNLMLNGKLYARYCEGETKYQAYSEDYAAFLFGLIELYQSTFNKKYLDLAVALNHTFFKYFYDIINGGYYFTDYENETIVFRLKEIYDRAIPSANAFQIYNLFRLHSLTDDIKSFEMAEQTLRLFVSDIKKHPIDCTFTLISILMRYFGSTDITVKAADNDNLDKIITAINNLDWPFINMKVIKENRPVPEFNVCRKGICYPPINEPNQLIELLKRD